MIVIGPNLLLYQDLNNLLSIPLLQKTGIGSRRIEKVRELALDPSEHADYLIEYYGKKGP